MEKPIYTVEVLKDINELWALENEFLNAIGEEPLEKDARKRLAEAIMTQKIIYFAARFHGQMIGICSVSPCFSTFACKS